MSNNEYQDYLDETKKSDNVALAAALSKSSMSDDHPLKEISKEVETYVTRKDKRGELNYVR